MSPNDLVEFHDTPNQSQHDAFQAWRAANPDGFFLTFKTRSKANLHVSTCHHLGSEDWTREETGDSLTVKRKVCCHHARTLEAWAAAQGLHVHHCLDCLGAGETDDEGAEMVPREDTRQTGVEAVEGIAREARVIARTRSGRLRAAALRLAQGVCAVCDTDFSKILDGKGTRVLQVHHKRQLSLSDEPQVNTVDDLAVVCANCHALLHLCPRRTLPIDGLRRMILGSQVVAGEEPKTD